MAITKCTVTKNVITSLGTTPQERGLTTEQFKAKFDEAPSGVIDYINNTLTAEVDSHLAENMSQLMYASRDISLDGVQTITGLIGIPKRIEIRAVITDWTKTSISIGSFELNGGAHSCYAIFTNAGGTNLSYSDNSFTSEIQIFKDEANYTRGTIQNLTPTQFEILWNKSSTAPTGTVDLQIIVHYHG